MCLDMSFFALNTPYVLIALTENSLTTAYTKALTDLTSLFTWIFLPSRLLAHRTIVVTNSVGLSSHNPLLLSGHILKLQFSQLTKFWQFSDFLFSSSTNSILFFKRWIRFFYFPNPESPSGSTTDANIFSARNDQHLAPGIPTPPLPPITDLYRLRAKAR